MKILILALSGIGDALMFSPALLELRKKMKTDQIDLLCMIKGVKELYEFNPNLNNVIYFNFLKEGVLNSLKYVYSIRKNYDVTINVYPANRKEYNIISFLIGAKNRLGVRYLRSDRSNLGFLNNITIEENDSLHNVQENLLMISKFLGNEKLNENGMEIYFDKKTENYADKYFENKINKNINPVSDGQIIIGFHTGCATLKNHIKRRWEPEKFSELGKKLIKEKKAKILLFGGPDEYELNDYINRLMNNEAVVIKTDTLLQTTALMKKCDLFITNDSALLHIASALKLNIVAIFGPTNTNYVHPWKTNYKIARLSLECQPCFYYSPKPLECSRNDLKFKCIKELSVEDVLLKVKEII